MDLVPGQQLADPCSTSHMQSPRISNNILYSFNSFIKFFDPPEIQYLMV